MKKDRNILVKCVFVIYTILLLSVNIINFISSSSVSYFCKKTFGISNLMILLIGILLILVYFVIIYKLKKKNIFIKLPNININVLSIILFIVQIYVFYNIYFHSSRWDAWIVYKNAEMISNGDFSQLNNFYFSSFPNNLMIVYLESLCIKFNRIFGVLDSEGIFLMILIQCITTSITGKLLYEILGLVNCSRKYALIGWLCYVFLVGLSGWNIIIYTDMAALIFPTLIFRIYLSLKNRKKIMWKWLCIFTLAYWGFKIKPTAIIILIAIGMNELIELLKCIKISKEKVAKKLKFLAKIAIIGSACIVAYASIFNVAIQSTGVIIDKEANTGALHMIMTGLNPENDGVWYEPDVNLSQSYDNRSDRKEAQIKKIEERLENYGVVGFLEHLKKKSLIIFNDGTFAWGNEGGFYDNVYPDKNCVVSPFLKSLYYTDGGNYLWLSTMEHFIWISVLFRSLGMIFVKKSKENSVIVTTLVGIILFNFIFEARARYLILYVPFFIIASMISIQQLERKFIHRIK